MIRTFDFGIELQNIYGTEVRTLPPALQMGFRKTPPITGTLIGNVHLACWQGYSKP